MRIAVLGSTGMLGSMVTRWLSNDRHLTLVLTARDRASLETAMAQSPGVEGRLLDAETISTPELAALLADVDWAVNAVGVIKPYIRDDVRAEVERAIRVNALFPQRLANVASAGGCKVIQIATDCVYAGTTGSYLEDQPHDPTDVYGKTKSLGEVQSDGMFHLRCSIIGPELKAHRSLLDWFLTQREDADLRGFTNHRWNGVTTLQFAKLCHGVISGGVLPPPLLHVVPGDAVSKADLLHTFARAYHKRVNVTPVEAPVPVDRTLATRDKNANDQLWKGAGYAKPPSIGEMVGELAAFTGAGARAGL